MSRTSVSYPIEGDGNLADWGNYRQVQETGDRKVYWVESPSISVEIK